jgi:hypothetical protein
LNAQIVGVSLDSRATLNLLQSLVDHPHHHYAEMAAPLTATAFDALVSHIRGYQQVPDATLLHLARVHDMKPVTFDQPIAALCPWPEHLEVLTP